jgi:hypothetical protein
LGITFGDGTGNRTIEVPFLVVPGAPIYNCIFGRPTLVLLDVVASIIDKYNDENEEIVTIHADLNGANRSYDAPSKNSDSLSLGKNNKTRDNAQ